MIKLRQAISRVSTVVEFSELETGTHYRLYFNKYGLMELHFKSTLMNKLILCRNPAPHIHKDILSIIKFINEFNHEKVQQEVNT